MGALVLEGHTRGIFVTTSDFQSGAADVAARSAARGIPIELVNAERFLEMLHVTARQPYADPEDWGSGVGDVKTVECSWYLGH